MRKIIINRTKSPWKFTKTSFPRKWKPTVMGLLKKGGKEVIEEQFQTKTTSLILEVEVNHKREELQTKKTVHPKRENPDGEGKEDKSLTNFNKSHLLLAGTKNNCRNK